MIKRRLHPLKYGYALVASSLPVSFSLAMDGIKNYFSQSQEYKKQAYHDLGREIGYRSLANREMFIIRHKDLPSELLSCISLANDLHAFSVQCLEAICFELQLDFSVLLNLIDEQAIPDIGEGSSVLRLVNYYSSDALLGNGCDEHQDLGLLTLVCYTGVPALEIYDFVHDQEWMDMETIQQEDDIIVMAGESLSFLSNGYYLPALHRVRQVCAPRLAVVYQLRFKHNAMLDSKQLETPVTGTFSKPFQISGLDFWNQEIKCRRSVNGTY